MLLVLHLGGEWPSLKNLVLYPPIVVTMYVSPILTFPVPSHLTEMMIFAIVSVTGLVCVELQPVNYEGDDEMMILLLLLRMMQVHRGEMFEEHWNLDRWTVVIAAQLDRVLLRYWQKLIQWYPSHQ